MVVALGERGSHPQSASSPEGHRGPASSPRNPSMQPFRVPAKDVRVQGVVVGLMRKF